MSLTSATEPNQEQLESRTEKEKNLMNILTSLSIRTKKAPLMNDKESTPLMKVQCEVQVKSEQ